MSGTPVVTTNFCSTCCCCQSCFAKCFDPGAACENGQPESLDEGRNLRPGPQETLTDLGAVRKSCRLRLPLVFGKPGGFWREFLLWGRGEGEVRWHQPAAELRTASSVGIPAVLGPGSWRAGPLCGAFLCPVPAGARHRADISTLILVVQQCPFLPTVLFTYNLGQEMLLDCELGSPEEAGPGWVIPLLGGFVGVVAWLSPGSSAGRL